MSGLFGGKPENSTETTYRLGPEQKQIFEYALPFLTKFASNPPTLPTESGVAPFNTIQQEAQANALSAARGAQTNLAQRGAQATNFVLGDVLYPGSNPALQSTIDAAVRPINETLTSQVLPNIRSEFRGLGQYGGSRQGIAEGIASRGALNAAGDTAAQVATSGYQSGLDALGRGLALLPQTQQAQVAPASTIGAVGDVQQSYEQAILSELLSRFNAQQYLPLSIGQELLSTIGAMPGGTSVATGSTPKSSPISSALGGAAVGAQFGPWGAAAGGGLGLLASLL